MSENNKDLTTSQKTEKVQKKESKPGIFQRAAGGHRLKILQMNEIHTISPLKRLMCEREFDKV